MTDKDLAEIVTRALLAIVAGMRKRYNLPEYKNITIEVRENDTITPIVVQSE